MKLALGTVQFGLPYGLAGNGSAVEFEECVAIIREARVSGVDTIDTAIAYGKSEDVLGRIGVDGLNVVTKLPLFPPEESNVSDWVTSQIHTSLKRLNANKLYGVLLHRPMQLLDCHGSELYRALRKLKETGLVSKIGISIYDTSELDALCDKYSFDIVQAPYNILDRRLVITGWADKLKSRGVEIHARSIFLQGLLLMPENGRPPAFDRWSSIWKTFDQWLLRVGLSPTEACSRFVNMTDEIDRVVVGVDTVIQLKEIIKGIKGSLCELPEFEDIIDQRLLNPGEWSRL